MGLTFRDCGDAGQPDPPDLPELAGGWARRDVDVGADAPCRLWVPRAPDALLDDEAVQERNRFNDTMPYWAWVWDSAPEMARLAADIGREVARESGGGAVLELGAGLGLVGLAAALAGGPAIRLTLSDHDPLALGALRVNASANGVVAAVLDLDWRRPDAVERGAFDVVLGCDVTYEGQTHEPLLDVMDRALASHGQAWLADPGRPRLVQFLKRASARGFRCDVLDAGGRVAEPEVGSYRSIRLNRDR